MNNRHIGYLAVLAAFGVVVALLDGTASRYLAEANRTSCASHMSSICAELQAYRASQPLTNYPARLGELKVDAMGAGAFVCPGSGTQAGSVTNLDHWTDYIYVVDSRPERALEMPLILCPPINHSGKLGGVVDGAGYVTWMQRSEFDSLLENLYSDTNLTILVSESLAKR